MHSQNIPRRTMLAAMLASALPACSQSKTSEYDERIDRVHAETKSLLNFHKVEPFVKNGNRLVFSQSKLMNESILGMDLKITFIRRDGKNMLVAMLQTTGLITDESIKDFSRSYTFDLDGIDDFVIEDFYGNSKVELKNVPGDLNLGFVTAAGLNDYKVSYDQDSPGSAIVSVIQKTNLPKIKIKPNPDLNEELSTALETSTGAPRVKFELNGNGSTALAFHVKPHESETNFDKPNFFKTNNCGTIITADNPRGSQLHTTSGKWVKQSLGKNKYEPVIYQEVDHISSEDWDINSWLDLLKSEKN